jgi:hypothetical protein
LRGPSWTLPFHISTDASDTTIGAVLGQKEVSLNYVIYFICKNMTPFELNYVVTEKEVLDFIHVINKVMNYIIGYEAYVHTNHSDGMYLMNNPIKNGRVTKWLWFL